MIKRFVVPAAAAAAAVLVIGCGSDEASGGGDTTLAISSLSKAQYVQQASEICAEVDIRVAKKAKPFFEEDTYSPGNFTKAIKVVLVPETEIQIDRIFELGAPKGNQARIEALIAAMRKAVDETQRLRKPTFDTVSEKFKQSDRLSRDYGLETCAFL